jgi:nucleoside-diphosphate-sugar epimerase
MKILITDASDTIGKVLMKCLAEKYDVLGIDKISSDNVIALDITKEPERLRENLKSVDIVIHLAWDVREAGTSLNAPIPENKIMGEIMYALSLEQKFPFPF